MHLPKLNRLLALTLSMTGLGLAVPLAAFAADSPVLALEGVLRNVAGGPAPDGAYAFGIALYDSAVAGQSVFEETLLSVPVSGGIFAIELGNNKVKIPENAFDAPRWVGVTITGSPELPRVRLHEVANAVRARNATTALGLQCSGCVTNDMLADGAVSAAKLSDGAVIASKIAAGAVQPVHVAFGYAASDEKGGVANQAKNADTATVAISANVASSAGIADKALALQCTGCVTAPMLADTVAADLVAAKKLAPVAVSGLYADLKGGPDLSGYGALAKDNKWSGAQWLAGSSTIDQATLGGPLNFAKNQALLFRFQVADKDPVPCDNTTLGLAYYDTTAPGLRICNGKAFVLSSAAVANGTANNPALSCKAILDADASSADGLYWIDPDGPGAVVASQLYCDMKGVGTADGGGWTLLTRLDTNDGASRIWTDTGFWNASADVGDVKATGDYMAFAYNSLLFTQIRLVYSYQGPAVISAVYTNLANTDTLRKNLNLASSNANTAWAKAKTGGAVADSFFGPNLRFQTTGNGPGGSGNGSDLARIWYNLVPVDACNQGGSIGQIGDYGQNNWTWEVARGSDLMPAGCQHNTYQLGVGSNYDKKSWGTTPIAPPEFYNQGVMSIYVK